MQVDVKAVELRFDAVALKNDVTQSIKELASEISGIDSQVQDNTKALIKKAEKSEVFEVPSLHIQ